MSTDRPHTGPDLSRRTPLAPPGDERGTADRRRYKEDGLRSLGRQIDERQASRPSSPDRSSAAGGPAARGGAGGGGRRARASHRARHDPLKVSSPRRRRLRRTLLALGIIVVVLAGSVVGYAWYLNDQINRVAVGNLSSAPQAGPDVGSENILMVGSTSRCALKVQNPAYGLCSQGITGVNSDVIMILHVNESKGQLSILSIPRDLFIPNARPTGPHKIDAALADGPSQLVAAIEQDFDIPIQHYVELNFDTFAGVVNALGGITMYFPMPVYDAYSGLNIQTAGCHHLNGFQALAVVRARHLQYKGPGVTSSNPQNWPQETQSDLARIRRDHEFLRVLASQVSKKGLGNPITDQQLVSSVVGQLTVDKGFSASHMVGLVLAFHGVNPYTVPQYTLPVMVSTSESYYYNGSNYGNIEFPSEPQDRQVIDQFLGLKPTSDRFLGTSLPKPGNVTVSVANGTGVYNQAADTGSALSALGFDVVGTGDTTPPAQQSETYVTYSSPADEAAAQVVANSLNGAVILQEGPTTDGAQVTVVTGTDFTVQSPPSASSGSGSSGSSSSGSSATGSGASGTGTSSQAFTSPTPATQSLAPWDPRACGPHGGVP